MFSFQTPLFLLLLLAIPIIYFIRKKKSRSNSVRFSTLFFIKQTSSTWLAKLALLPNILIYTTLALMIISLARPRISISKEEKSNEGLAISIVIDRSLSMQDRMLYNGRQQERLEVVKEIFEQFVFGDGQKLQGRPNDLISLTIFAALADTICPFTQSHEILRGYLKTLTYARFSFEQGTAIGDALALASTRLKDFDKNNKSNFKIKNKIIILLSDGSNNRGSYSPEDAAEMARRWGIKVYCIGIVPSNSNQVITRGSMDEDTLKDIAKKTNGRYWSACDGESLKSICMQLDELEKSKYNTETYVNYHECFTYTLWLAIILALTAFYLKITIFSIKPN